MLQVCVILSKAIHCGLDLPAIAYLITVPASLDVQVGDIQSHSVVLSWQPLEGKNDTGGSPIISYDITYWCSEDEQ